VIFSNRKHGNLKFLKLSIHINAGKLNTVFSPMHIGKLNETELNDPVQFSFPL